jgi:hypothetical protein
MRQTSFALLVVLACGLSPAIAQAPEASTPRYAFNPVNDGFLRLDNSTGQVSFCNQTSAGWACQAVPEDRAALEKEIARLQDEVASLKSQVAALREPPMVRPPADLTPPTEKRDDAARLREDVDRARVAIETAWRRLVDMISNFQKDVLRKG